MSLFTLNTTPARTTTENEVFNLVWWPIWVTILGGVMGTATAQALTGDLFPLLGLSLSLVTLPVGGWLMELWPSLEELPVPQDGWAMGLLEELGDIPNLPEDCILPLPAPVALPRLARTSREVLTDLLREAATHLQEEGDEFDMHAEACMAFIWV